jgi:dihydropteroate synthase
VTPDSFYDGGRFFDPQRAMEHAERLVAEGADILDIGGESSRPGSDPVSADEELRRVGQLIETLAVNLNVPISIDTYRAQTAARCLELGATMVNDITGLRDAAMREVVARHDVPAVIMHMQGEPKTMQQAPSYSDVVSDVKDFLSRRARDAAAAGVRQVIVDPGIGFGKTAAHNMELLRRLQEFSDLPYPLLVGVSRKSSIGQITGAPPDERLPGTLAATAIAVLNGANIVRVHDVKECKQAVRMAEAIREA